MARIRKIQVFIGPFEDLLGKGRAGAKVVETTGKTNEIRIRFSIKKTITGAPNDCAVVFTNLSPETRHALRQKSLSIELWGGYEDEEIRLIAKGGVLYVTHERKDAEIDTTVIFRDGWGALLNADYSRSYSSAEPLSVVVSDIAKSIEGVETGRINLAGSLSSKGRTLAGNPRDLLNRLADQYGFSWSIQDGVFQAIDDDKSRGLVYRVDNILLNANPILNGPEQIKTGIEMSTILDPRIIPGDVVEVNPTVDEDLSGQYKVFDMVITGDSHGSAWNTTLTSKVFLT
ncbi:hypothetical protein F9L16_23900 [Agarivorans sp. B2Z047]|uniref:hypothetical protein n=1 Tax=Agarivorans sp. B2Z047 TaxID=2652721 RepID=UPI00128DA0CD|nr:hypothetical protein [Agarivorans sp. B2Z047]MPW31994.1 hypothetical protein [Agarivorans sp. B2Z047]UQN41866.1 hypothetical protein LQZ07_19120 [Agarivorans sp. B2Z047]